ncbi:AraC family transcriptional regulator [Alteromonas sp. 1_MG-2023]|uniref:helix-turn-helix domain-containing protein n=1 Tax=Alteromonas sp. 1_MG-2023 TaxID=3062669 RepID=UPI0026E2D5A0|nr:AraC family transcriptional regulator [Alteromonas sp. 1_MG-2023]MDO6474116.1 AraC family transcriptional regulator [Alteromonas sp. 1_MG-2023]
MDKTLFNLHDLVLLLIAFECLVVAIYIGFNRSGRSFPTSLLIAFFVVHACISVHELVLWGSTFRYWVLESSPNYFFTLNFAYWLDGPLLFLFACAVTQQDFALKRWHAFFLLPLLVFGVFIYQHFYALPYDVRVTLIKNYSFADFDYVFMDLLAKLIRVAFAVYAVLLILKSDSQIKEKYNVPAWLPKVLMVLTGILAWETMLSAIKVYHSLYGFPYYEVVELIGLASYYMQFGLLNVVIFMAASHFLRAQPVKAKTVQREPVSEALIGRLESTMESERPYLNQNLSFERLAEKLDIPVKELSNAINRHYEVNFYEFINNYRIQEARQMLEDPAHNDKSITNIFYDAGFNSKSVYNTLFKKKFNKTPSQYRNDFKNKQARQSA